MPEVSVAVERGRAPERRRWWRRIVPGVAALLAVTVVEIGMQLNEAALNPTYHKFAVDDPIRGTALKAGYAGWAVVENRVWVSINSDGMRDREHPLVAPPGTLRVAVLGDSYIQGMNVPFEKTFTSSLERALTQCVPPAMRAEVLNFGVSGYGTAQQLLTYRHHAAKYRPDIVVLAVYTSNDVFGNHRELDESPAAGTPYFVLDGDRLVLDRPQPLDGRAAYPFYQRWRLAMTERLMSAALLYRWWGTFRDVVEGRRADPAIVGLGIDEVYRPPTTPAIADAWRVTEALVVALAREAAAQGAELWIVTLSNAEQVHPDPAARRAYAENLGVPTLLYPDHRIRDFARANRIPVVTLVEPLAEYAATRHVFLNGGYNTRYPPGTGHWNETANHLGAGIVGARLCAGSAKMPGRAAAGR